MTPSDSFQFDELSRINKPIVKHKEDALYEIEVQDLLLA
jgi:hypothetical protein